MKTIRIQNFRSLEDVTINLEDVNLLIGPNNSGKSNFFKALEFLKAFFEGEIPAKEELKSLFFMQRMKETREYNYKYPPLSFSIINNDLIYHLAIYGFDSNQRLDYLEVKGVLKRDFDRDKIHEIEFENLMFLTENVFYSFLYERKNHYQYQKIENNKFIEKLLNTPSFLVTFNEKKSIEVRDVSNSLGDFLLSADYSFPKLEKFTNNIAETFKTLKTYTIDVSSLKKPYPTLEEDRTVQADASNLVAFLDNMDDAYPDIVDKITKDLKLCIKEFKNIVYKKVKLHPTDKLVKLYGDKTFKKIGLRDKYKQTYWSNELSDGTLYFLALLSIINQPYPPKLLLLEEPENGIHPRRIKEIIDFLFELVELKDIQIILTTHSTYVIDEFKDLPESIFVFDKKEQHTTVKNLKTDIIEEDAQKSEEMNLPPLDLSGSLGEHWASGLIGGVPV